MRIYGRVSGQFCRFIVGLSRISCGIGTHRGGGVVVGGGGNGGSCDDIISGGGSMVMVMGNGDGDG